MWDSQNRLVRCTVNGTTSAYTYGNDGLRRSATTGLGTADAKTTYYVYDGQSMVQERQASVQGQVVPSATYLTGQRGPECRIDETQTESYYDSHYHPQVRGKTSWYVYDGLGSVMGEVDQNGNLTTSARYDVYGGVRVRSGTATTAHGFVGNLGHTSDASTGLVYMRARYYDPNVGRFISEDPGKNEFNRYVYADNNPIRFADKDGKSPWDTGMLVDGLVTLGLQAILLCGFLLKIKGDKDSADSADVEDQWGKFTEAYGKADPLFGDNNKSETEDNLTWALLLGVTGAVDGGSLGGAMMTAMSDATQGASAAIFIYGYEARVSWYVDHCD